MLSDSIDLMDAGIVITARRTESRDAEYIAELVTANTDALFGRVDIIKLMYVSSHL